jgi:monoamine oxidase
MAGDPEVIVIGAGAAGLAAAAELGLAGLSVVLLEARDRIGGRIFTQRDPVCNAPVELGAEFIHGRPPEIWRPLTERGVPITEVDGENWCFQSGQLFRCDFLSQVDAIMKEMDDRSPDETFLSFLQKCCPESKNNSEAKEQALRYVTGFNAADPDLVGVHWLVKGMRAEEQIGGGQAFRSRGGYEDLIEVFRQKLVEAGVRVQTATTVESIWWKAGRAEVTAASPTGSVRLVAPYVLVTLPLAVLQAPAGESGAVQFLPGLPDPKLEALNKLQMGKVIRVTLRFRHRFWDTLTPVGTSQTLSKLSFLFGQDDWFPTWWTMMPDHRPIITGWAPFRCAERLSGKSRAFVIDRGLKALSKPLRVGQRELQDLLDDAYFHDWQSDPFSRGAYSYGAVGSDGAQEALGSPMKDTLFFAGEATDVSGNNGTVHGAIASGLRAAAEILRTKR